MQFADQGGEGLTPYEVLFHAALTGDHSVFSRCSIIRRGTTPTAVAAGGPAAALGSELRSLTYLIARPPVMVEGVVGTLRAAGVPEAQLRPESFRGY